MDESALSCDTKQGNSDCNSDANCMWDPGESKCVGLCPVIPGGDSEKRYAGENTVNLEKRYVVIQIKI